MDIEKRNRIIVVLIVCLLLLAVSIFAIYSVVHSKEDVDKSIKVKINQIYLSDYDLEPLGNEYFIGTYEENMISVIIDNNGKEVYKGLGDIYYDGVYPMKDGRYLIYSNKDNKLTTYIFDGVNIKLFYEIEDVYYVKPIIYKNVDKEYIIGFASMVEDDLYLYNLNSSGIIVVNDAILVADYNDNGVYYTYNEEYFVVKNNDSLMGVIDTNGIVVIDYKYKDIINTYYDSFVALNKKGKYGIIDKNNKTLVKFKYKVIDSFKDYYILVNSSNKMALYDLNYKKVSDFEMNYDSLKEYDLRSEYNSINLYKVDGKVVVINNYLEDRNGIEYDKHNLYVIDNGKITDKISQVGFGNNDVLYTYDSDYNISIYDMYFKLMFKFKLDDVKKINSISYISSNVIRVSYITTDNKDIIVYYDINGNEVDFGLGELVIKNVDYYGYLKQEGDKQKVTLYDIEGNYLDDIIGDSIKINGEFLIVDNSIYKIEIKS